MIVAHRFGHLERSMSARICLIEDSARGFLIRRLGSRRVLSWYPGLRKGNDYQGVLEDFKGRHAYTTT
jgi:hypothetical protein